MYATRLDGAGVRVQRRGRRRGLGGRRGVRAPPAGRRGARGRGARARG